MPWQDYANQKNPFSENVSMLPGSARADFQPTQPNATTTPGPATTVAPFQSADPYRHEQLSALYEPHPRGKPSGERTFFQFDNLGGGRRDLVLGPEQFPVSPTYLSTIAPATPTPTPAVPFQPPTSPAMLAAEEARAARAERWGGPTGPAYNPTAKYPVSEILSGIGGAIASGVASGGMPSLPTVTGGFPSTPVVGASGAGTFTNPGFNPNIGWAQDRATAEDHLVGWADRPPAPAPWVETNFAASNQGNWDTYGDWAGVDKSSESYRRFMSGLKVNDPQYSNYLRMMIQYDPAVASAVSSGVLLQFGLTDLYEAKLQAELELLMSSSPPFQNPQVMPYRPRATVPGSSRGYP